MNIFSQTFNTLLIKPLFNALILLYEYSPGRDFGIAIIALTILVRIALYPLMVRAIKSRKALSKLQPKVKEVQEKFKDDQKKQMEEITRLYKEENINPLGALLPSLIQLPLLIALFQVFWKGVQSVEAAGLYSFVPLSGEINYTFLGLINISQMNIVLAVLTAIAQFFQLKISTSKSNDKASEMSQKQMPYFFSAFTFIFLLRLPAALALYWLTTSVFLIIQEYSLKNYDKSR